MNDFDCTCSLTNVRLIRHDPEVEISVQTSDGPVKFVLTLDQARKLHADLRTELGAAE